MAQVKIQEAMASQISTQKSDPYAHIELTPEELSEAISFAKKKKAARLHELAYIENLKPKVYPIFNAEEYGDWVLARIRKIMPEFILDSHNEKQFQLLTWYFTNDERYTKAGFIFNKGIALLGPIGCGKTTLLRAFNVNPNNSFVMVSCRSVADQYSHKEYGGEPVIQKYSTIAEVPKNDYWGQDKVGRAYDDMGTENTVKHYGNEKNVMEEILQNRYDNFSLRGKTHITTNLSAEQIQDIYGARVRDRCREMFNWHKFDINSPSRRK